VLAALAGGLAVGLLAAVIGARLFDGDDAGTPAANRTVAGEVDSPGDLLAEDLPVPPGAGAESAEAAVAGFLEAEQAGDFETSFGYLDDAGRAAYASPAGWVSDHANVLPTILDHELGERVPVADGRETVTATLRLEPGLDQVVGLTPGEAVVRWDVVQGVDGWGIALETSPFEPVWPDAQGAVPAARAWAQARQRCESPANERTGLVGSPALADTLCDARGGLDVGAPEALDEVTGQSVFTAFGPEALTVARLVRISGTAELTSGLAVVLVPIGDDWTVIGVLP
jgi:hypothetical protein